MSAPQQPPAGDGSGDSSSSTTTAAKYRPGQLVSYKFADRISERELDGFAVVVRVDSGEGAAVVVAPLSSSHLQIVPDDLAAAKGSDLTTSVPAPAEA